MMICWPSAGASFCAITRAIVSTPPPGGYGTTSVIGRDGIVVGEGRKTDANSDQGRRNESKVRAHPLLPAVDRLRRECIGEPARARSYACSRGPLRTSMRPPGPGSSLIASSGPTMPMSISRSGRITMPRVPIRTVTMRAGVRARAFERPALQGLEVRRTAPRAGKARIDERRHVPAFARHQRELRLLGLPVRRQALLQHPVAIEGAALGRPRLIDAAALAAHAMRTPLPGGFSSVRRPRSACSIACRCRIRGPAPRAARRSCCGSSLAMPNSMTRRARADYPANANSPPRETGGCRQPEPRNADSEQRGAAHRTQRIAAALALLARRGSRSAARLPTLPAAAPSAPPAYSPTRSRTLRTQPSPSRCSRIAARSAASTGRQCCSCSPVRRSARAQPRDLALRHDDVLRRSRRGSKSMFRNQQWSHHRERDGAREHCLLHAGSPIRVCDDGRAIRQQTCPQQEENADEMCSPQCVPSTMINLRYSAWQFQHKKSVTAKRFRAIR